MEDYDRKPEKHWVDDEHYRIVSKNGKESLLYRAESGILGVDSIQEISEHRENGTTQAYEFEGGILWTILSDNKGRAK